MKLKFLSIIFSISLSVMLVSPTSSLASMRNFNKLIDTDSLFDVRDPNQNGIISNFGPYKVGFRFCKQLQAIAPILLAYSNISWPVTGVGYTIGLVSNQSSIMIFCKHLIALESLDTEGLIRAGADLLNTVTKNRWTQHFKQADVLWNTANSIYDPSKGEFRAGALTSASTHRKFVQLANNTKKWYNGGEFDGKGEALETKQSRQAELNKIARLSYKNAILSEAIDCPEPKVKKDFIKEYKRSVSKEKQKKRLAEIDIKEITLFLLNMGKNMLIDNNDLNEYATFVEKMNHDGVKFLTRNETGKISRTVAHKTEKDSEGFPKLVEEEESVIYQKVYVESNYALFEQFRKKYVAQWESYITKMFFQSGLKSFLADKDGLNESKFRSFSYECSTRKLDPSLRLTSEEISEKRKKCKESLTDSNKKFEEKDVKNLLEFYVLNLEKALKEQGSAEAAILTFESKYSSEPVLPDASKTRTTEAQKDEANVKAMSRSEMSCKPELSPGEMQSLQVQQQKLQAEIAQATFETVQKQKMFEEEKAKKEASDAESTNKLIENAKKAQENQVFDTIVPSNIRPSIKW